MHWLIRRAMLAAALLLTGGIVAYRGSTDASQWGQRWPHHQQAGYEVINLPSLGGTASAGISINDTGLVAGYSNLPGDETRHAATWQDDAITDLGTLGGQNSSVLWPVKNNSGVIVGIAETGEQDPLGEAWSCSFFFPSGPTGNTCVGFVWEDGEMRPLPTFGGNHGFAAGLNNNGQAVGWAENTVEDETCNDPQVLQFRAALWDLESGGIEELPPLAGDTVSAATAINDRGQVVGISGICSNAVGGLSAIHAVLWEDGEVIDIGNLGGVAWNTPMAINDRGDVVGFSNVSAEDGETFNAHAFLWTEADGIQDLGALPGHTESQALGINNRGQIVGMSCGEDACRAFLWEGGVMKDLNALVGSGYDGHLTFANDINNRGQITGAAVDAGSGDEVAFVATPTRGRGWMTHSLMTVIE